jgi:hypothetical protein
MATYELSTNDHGLLAEVLAGRYAGFPDSLENKIKAHLRETYSAPDGSWDEISLRSEDRELTGEFHFGMLEDVEIPDDGPWGYSSGWIPDDVIAAVARQRQDSMVDLSKFFDGEGESRPGPLTVYYAIEVKAVTRGSRVRLTGNQQELLPAVSENLDHVHPVIVTVDLNGLPEAVEVDVDIFENSVWGDGQTSKTV